VNRGNAIVEVLVLGMVLVLVLLQLVVGFGRLHAAGDAVTEAAQVAALWAARSGSAADAERVAQELSPDAEVESWRAGAVIYVTVRRPVAVIGPVGSPISYWVVGRGAASVGRYRSDG